ncbi:MAG TPA: cation-translocating P-type ATPase [Acidimicrobiia bacterium]
MRLRVSGLAGRDDWARALEARLGELGPVRAVRVLPRTGNVVVWRDGPALPAHELVLLITTEIATRKGAEGTTAPIPGHADHDDGDVLRLVIGGAVLGLLMLRRAVLRRPPVLSGGGRTVATAVAVFTGYPFFRGAVRSLTGGRKGAGTDLLVTAATIASLVLRESVVALTVLWLLNIGEHLQALTLRRTRRAIEDLVSLGGGRVWIVTESGEEVEVSSDDLAPGDVVAVYEHSVLPVDGAVVDGEAVVDQAAVTGESFPVYVTTGDEVFAGTVMRQGSLRIRTVRVGRETTAGRIISRVEEAQADRAPIETIATRFSRRFVPASFALAGLTWLLTGDPRRAMTMLLVACPCAAGLSTPTAVSAAIGNGARRGILIKGGSHLEAAGRVSAVVFDKTGTLTVGRPLVTNIVAFGEGWSPERVLAYAASSEVHVRHPLAQAVVRHTEEAAIEIPLHEECEVLLGLGMRVVAGGDRLLLGSPRLMARSGVPIDDDAATWIKRLEAAAETPICLAHNGQLVGLLGVTDAVRVGAAEVTAELRRIGVHRVVMLTGDTRETATAVAAELGVDDWQARVLPEEKLEAVRALQRQGHVVAVVGDGTNDAPALAAADIGIAMGLTATDVAVETADVALAGSHLPHVVGVIDLGRSTLRVVRQNYALAIGVNTLGLLAGTFGTLNPVLAAVLHNASSVAVVLNSSRLIGYEPGRGPNGRPRDRARSLPGRF